MTLEVRHPDRTWDGMAKLWPGEACWDPLASLHIYKQPELGLASFKLNSWDLIFYYQLMFLASI